MTREDINDLALVKIDRAKCLMLELITGTGKTKIAINLINHICNRANKPVSVLILVAKTVHKQTWADEIIKWGGLKTDNVITECYESLHKYRNSSFDIVVMDEVQHLSEARRDILETIKVKESIICLSATINNDLRNYLRWHYSAEFIRCGLREAVEDNILPDPTVYLMPLKLDNIRYNYKAKRFKKDVVTTQKGYYDIQSSLIEWYKNKYFNSRNERIKNLWLSTAGKRLKWLSEQKEDIIHSIQSYLKDCKTLTFCSSIEQSERLGKYNITSKNKDSIKNLDMFNSNRIKHITACSILNEGE